MFRIALATGEAFVGLLSFGLASRDFSARWTKCLGVVDWRTLQLNCDWSFVWGTLVDNSCDSADVVVVMQKINFVSCLSL